MRAATRALADASVREVLAIAHALIERFGRRFVAYELIHFHRETLASLRAANLRRLGKGIDSWGAVDTFCGLVAGPVWRERQVPDSPIHGWAHSQDRWWRRAALVSTTPLNVKARGGSGDTKRRNTQGDVSAGSIRDGDLQPVTTLGDRFRLERVEVAHAANGTLGQCQRDRLQLQRRPFLVDEAAFHDGVVGFSCQGSARPV